MPQFVIEREMPGVGKLGAFVTPPNVSIEH